MPPYPAELHVLLLTIWVIRKHLEDISSSKRPHNRSWKNYLVRTQECWQNCVQYRTYLSLIYPWSRCHLVYAVWVPRFVYRMQSPVTSIVTKMSHSEAHSFISEIALMLILFLCSYPGELYKWKRPLDLAEWMVINVTISWVFVFRDNVSSSSWPWTHSLPQGLKGSTAACFKTTATLQVNV